MSKQKAALLIIGAIAFIILMSILAGKAQAEGVSVGSDCGLTWTAPTAGGPVEGYRVYVGSTSSTKTQRAQVAVNRVDCAALNLTQGQHYAHVTAYNVAGESGASNTLPFVLVTTAPGAPTLLRLTAAP